jgi:hypothetical protein
MSILAQPFDCSFFSPSTGHQRRRCATMAVRPARGNRQPIAERVRKTLFLFRGAYAHCSMADIVNEGDVGENKKNKLC